MDGKEVVFYKVTAIATTYNRIYCQIIQYNKIKLC